MKFDNTNAILKIFLQGRIDSNNAAEVEENIMSTINDNAHQSLVLDLDDLSYISSAGLRIILKLKKMDKTLKLINVSTEVYEIFDMTGFTEMMEISKAYKKISIEGCELIGQGANGKVYRIDGETIVKVYESPDCLDDIKRERALAKKAFVLGIPTAISYEIARIGDSYGTVFELLDAKSIAKLLGENPGKIDEYVDMYVDLLKKIHATKVDDEDMVDMRQTAINWATFDAEYLPKDVGDKLISLVKAVPKSNNMMHGDYHIKNVMVQNGEVLLIDMDTLCVGDPIFELGSMFNAYEGFSSMDESISLAFLGIPHALAVDFWRKTLKKYLGTEDEKVLDEVEKKAKILGFMRLLRRIIRRGGFEDSKKKKEVDYFIEQLTKLVPEVDTLSI